MNLLYLNLRNNFKKKFILASLRLNPSSWESLYRKISSPCVKKKSWSSLLNISDLYFGPEGGFHHAAAALNKKAVVIFGGFIDPLVTGYDFHNNIYVDIDGSPCGSRVICKHCKDCIQKIDLSSLENMIINS